MEFVKAHRRFGHSTLATLATLAGHRTDVRVMAIDLQAMRSDISRAGKNVFPHISVYIIIQLNDRTYRTICSEPKVTANKNIHSNTNKCIFLFIYIAIF